MERSGFASQEPLTLQCTDICCSELKTGNAQCRFRLFSTHVFSCNPDPLPDVTGGANAQQASPCKDAACLLGTVQLLRSIANAEACEGEPPEKSDDSSAATTATNGSSCRADECCGSAAREFQGAVPCSHRPFPASIPSNKVQPMPIVGVSPHHQQKKKTAMVRLSFRRRSYEGDDMTEMCELLSTLTLSHAIAMPSWSFRSIAELLLF